MIECFSFSNYNWLQITGCLIYCILHHKLTLNLHRNTFIVLYYCFIIIITQNIESNYKNHTISINRTTFWSIWICDLFWLNLAALKTKDAYNFCKKNSQLKTKKFRYFINKIWSCSSAFLSEVNALNTPVIV